MTTDDKTPLAEDRVAELEQENEVLRSSLERLEKQQERAAQARKVAGGLGARILAGPELWASSRAWFEKLSKIESPRELASPESADLVTALVRRVVRVGIVGLVLAALPAVFLLTQTYLLREQNAAIQEQNAAIRGQNAAIQEQVERQASDTLIVRRAQLLATIYEEECEDAAELVPQSTTDTRISKRAAANEVCRVKAHPRARVEAVLALCEVERGREMRPDLSFADLGELSLSRADLRQVLLVGADLGGSDLRGAKLTNSVLKGANLRKSRLLGADLSGADLSFAALNGTELAAVYRGPGTDNSMFGAASFSEANLEYSDLSGVNLMSVEGLTQAQIESARGDAKTWLPEGLTRPEHWPARGR